MNSRVLRFHQFRINSFSEKDFNLTERMIAANEIWYDLVSMQIDRQFQESPLVNRNMLFLLFGRFVHLLIHDQELRGKLLEHIEAQMKEEI